MLGLPYFVRSSEALFKSMTQFAAVILTGKIIKNKIPFRIEFLRGGGLTWKSAGS